MTGVVLIAGLLGLLWLDARLQCMVECRGEALPWWTGGAEGLALAAVAVVLLAPIAGMELARLLRGAGMAVPTWVVVSAAVAGACALRVAPEAPSAALGVAIVAGAAWVVLVGALLGVAPTRRMDGTVAAVGGALVGFVYLGVMIGVWLLARREASVWVVAGAVLTIKASDTGAYFTGRLLGRRKLIHWLSPGKTWEGFLGGMAWAAAVGGALAWWSQTHGEPADQVPVVLGVIGGAVLGVVAPFGDLVESLLKRSAGAKDSGTLLPGMGGALDVLDSLLLAGPVVYGLLLFRAHAS